MKKTKFKITEIRKIVNEKHKYFLEIAGSESGRILADLCLNATIIEARLLAIIRCFLSEEVIDGYTKDGSYGYPIFVLTKFGAIKKVLIVVGENYILFRSSAPVDIFSEFNRGTFESETIKQNDELEDGYSWEEVTVALSDFIYKHIYERPESVMMKLFK